MSPRGADVPRYSTRDSLTYLMREDTARLRDQEPDTLPAHVAQYRARRTPPVIMCWPCVTCHGEWTDAGSYARGACTRCGTSRPASTA